MKKSEITPRISNKKLIEKDKHHISWKNHGIENYIKEAMEAYLKNKKRN